MSTLVELDVLIVGAGPAGAAAAAVLARDLRVGLVERAPGDAPRIGESLPAAALRLLDEIGVGDRFRAEQRTSWFADRSVWGSHVTIDRDFIADPDGAGVHIDRARFDALLRAHAVERGVRLFRPAWVDDIARNDEFDILLAGAARGVAVRCRFLVDATGRRCALARRFGARRRADDRLCAVYAHGEDHAVAARGVTLVEAVHNGWWYSAPLPEERRVIAFHTDADLHAERPVLDAADLLVRARATHELAPMLDAARFAADDGVVVVPAYGASLAPPIGDDWIAVGDASLAFDPLSSQGLLHALYTGVVGAGAVRRILGGTRDAMTAYAENLTSIREAYLRGLHAAYAAELRFEDAPFWMRRRLSSIARGREEVQERTAQDGREVLKPRRR